MATDRNYQDPESAGRSRPDYPPQTGNAGTEPNPRSETSAVEPRLDHPLDYTDWTDTEPSIHTHDRVTIETAARALTGTLSPRDTFEYLTDAHNTGRLEPGQASSLRAAGSPDTLTRSDLSGLAQALRASSDDAAGRLGRLDANPAETAAFNELMRDEAVYIVLAKSEFYRDYGPWLEGQADMNTPSLDSPSTQQALRNVVNHRLHHITQEPWDLPNRLDALRTDLQNASQGDLPRWFNPATMTIPAEEAGNRTNWLVPRSTRHMPPEQAAEYLLDQMKSHGIGTTGDTDPETFAMALIDQHVDPALAEEWRTGPTTYHQPPRNPLTGDQWDDPTAHTKATYAWLLRDALHVNWLPRNIWMADGDAIVEEAAEKGTRLELLASFADQLSHTAHSQGDRSADPPEYRPRFPWNADPQTTCESVLSLTEQSEDLDPLWRETVRIENYITHGLASDDTKYPWHTHDEDYNNPRALMLQEAICNLQEIRIGIYKITIEQTDRDENLVDTQDMLDQLAALYQQEGYPLEYIEETTKEYRTAILDPPHTAEGRDRYITAELRAIASRLAHIDYNLSAIHAAPAPTAGTSTGL